MKLSISNIAWGTEYDLDVYRLMEQYSFNGLEIAPTRIFPQTPYEKLKEARKWSTFLRNTYGFEIPSMQSIWYGRKENIFTSMRERDVLLDYTIQAVDFAAVIGCRNLVFGCPRNRNLPEGANADTAVEFFKELGDYAYEKGTVIGLEANPPIYNTNYINDTKSALALIKQVASKGFKLNLDVGTMIQNQESILDLKNNVYLINHVHISEPGLRPIRENNLHYELKELLCKEQYVGFVSIEVGKTDNISIIQEQIKYVKEVFS